jgi:hypothetical protein
VIRTCTGPYRVSAEVPFTVVTPFAAPVLTTPGAAAVAVGESVRFVLVGYRKRRPISTPDAPITATLRRSRVAWLLIARPLDEPRRAPTAVTAGTRRT